MAQALIIADDLTGALDSSVAFAARGLRVVVALTPAHLAGAFDQDPDVIAVCTGSREMSSDDACAAVACVCNVVGRFPGVLLKKVDSRLKGQVASEVDTLSAAVPRPVLAAPAIPRLGRFVVDGAVTGAGVATPIDVAGALGRPAEVPDIRTDADFDEVLPDDIEGTLFVGAAGLAEALARRLVPGAAVRAAPAIATPVLAAIGSRDPVTVAQVEALDGDRVVRAPNGDVPAVHAAARVVVQMVAGGDSISAREAESRFSRGIADLVDVLMPATLFACGGESAAALLRRLDVGLLEVKGEVLPGIPVSRALDGRAGLDVVTKSGGFGPCDTLDRFLGLASAPATDFSGRSPLAASRHTR